MRNPGMKQDAGAARLSGVSLHSNGGDEIFADLKNQKGTARVMDVDATMRALENLAETVRPVLHRAGFTQYADPLTVRLQLTCVQACTEENDCFTVEVYCPTYGTHIILSYGSDPDAYHLVVSGAREIAETEEGDEYGRAARRV